MRRSALILVFLASWLSFSSEVLSQGKKTAPPHSNAFGKSLVQWMDVYWTQAIAGGEGFVNRVRLLPLPDAEYAGGMFTIDDPGILVGELELTQEPGTPFVLPILAWVGETYASDSDVPDDMPLPDEIFTGANVLLTLNGQSLIDSETEGLSQYYYGDVYFAETLLYEEPTSYDAIGAIFVQGLGFVHQPLPVGEHILTLHAELLVDDFNLGVVFENTWIITVQP